MVSSEKFGSLPTKVCSFEKASISTGKTKSQREKVMALVRKLLQVFGLTKHADRKGRDHCHSSTEKIFSDGKRSPETCSSLTESLSSTSSFSVLESSGITTSPISEGSYDYGTFSADQQVRENIANQVKDLVASSPFCNVYMKDPVAMKVAEDVVSLAQNEPCGLRGCRVLVFLEDRGQRNALGNFLPEEGFICTFEVSVVLWVKKLGCKSFLPFSSCMPRGQQINSSYDICKDKLYTCNNSRAPTPVNWQS